MFHRWTISESALNMWIELLVRFVLVVIFFITEEMEAFVRIIQPEEQWLYRNPVARPDTIPTVTLFTIVVTVPLAVILIFTIIRRDKLDCQQALLALTLTLVLNGVVTNTIKLLVGRPRPDFLFRCFPDGKITNDMKCTGNSREIIEGRKSFPSGHSSWSFSSLGFTSMYLASKLHCFESQGRGKSWRLCLSGAPLLAAIMIAITRTSDYRHHWQDIVVGSILGFCIMLICYKQYYPPLTSPACDKPYASKTNHSTDIKRTDFTLNSVMVMGGGESNPNVKHI
ncbi:phospholipid phosphatase 4-like [Amphiura filiformis]|uniref:phospholipid phosphatase 4-like n=1 Tax=Amphiura filiformis TaxID=82378 RepID=UPI003B20D4AF